MPFAKKVREIIDPIARNLWVRLISGLISGIAAYLQFKEAGWTPLFWVLSALTLLALSLGAVPIIRERLWKPFKRRMQWNEIARSPYSHQQRVETLSILIQEFVSIEKAKCLADVMEGRESIRILAILPVEGKLGVILNVGREENLQVGTQLLVYRTDEYTPDGEHIEQPIGLVQVTYVQAQNNCSQAIVWEERDTEFWNQAAMRVETEGKINPPQNFAVPYIPPELSNLSREDLVIFKQYLETIRDSLTHSESDQIAQEENVND